MSPILRAAAAALALALLLAAPALAQPQGQGQLRARNQTLVAQAAEAYGFTSARFTPAQEQAIGDAWEQLLPGENQRAYRLNRTQALAIAYVALVLRASPGRGGWDDASEDDDDFGGRPGRPGGPGGPGGPGRAELREAISVAFELAAAIPSETMSNGLFLTGPEIERIRSATPEIQRRAIAGGCTSLAGEASRLAQSVAGSTLPDRRVVATQIDRLENAARQCQP